MKAKCNDHFTFESLIVEVHKLSIFFVVAGLIAEVLLLFFVFSAV